MTRKGTLIWLLVTVLITVTAGYGGAWYASRFYDGFQTQAQLSGEMTDDGADDGAVSFTESDGSYVYSQNVLSANRMPLTIPEIVSAVADSVVEIATETVMTGRFSQRTMPGAGSGVILSIDGYIVTNNHVIENADNIYVRLRNGTAYEARLIGRDIKSDLAVIKIEAIGLKPAHIGNSDGLVVGELAVAIGNPLGSLGGTVTEGIISALNRDIYLEGEYMSLLQTSAAVSPGNSGGGLFNQYGELIAIINAKSSGSDIEGIGFAIPGNTVDSVVSQLIQYGYVLGRVDFGIDMIDILDTFTAMRYRLSGTGVYVGRDDDDSGLRSSDRIIRVAGEEVRSSSEVKAVYEQYKVGDILQVVIERGGKQYTVNVTLKQAKA